MRVVVGPGWVDCAGHLGLGRSLAGAAQAAFRATAVPGQASKARFICLRPLSDPAAFHEAPGPAQPNARFHAFAVYTVAISCSASQE